jgi:hypothetical protein
VPKIAILEKNASMLENDEISEGLVKLAVSELTEIQNY